MAGPVEPVPTGRINLKITPQINKLRNVSVAPVRLYITDTYENHTTPTPSDQPTGLWATFKVRIAPAVELAGKGLDKLSEAAQWVYREVVALKNDLLGAKDDIAKQKQIAGDRLRKLEETGQGNSLEALSLKQLLVKLDELDRTVQSKLDRLAEIQKEIEGGVSPEVLKARLKEREKIEKELKIIQGQIAEINKILSARAENAEPGSEDAALIIKGLLRVLAIEAKVISSAEASRKINDLIIALLPKLPPESREEIAKFIGESYETCNDILGSVSDVQVETAALAPRIQELVSADAKIDGNTATIITQQTSDLAGKVADARVALTASADNYIKAVTYYHIKVDITILVALLTISLSQAGATPERATPEAVREAVKAITGTSRSFTRLISDIFSRISKARMAELVREIFSEKNREADAAEKKEIIKREKLKAEQAKIGKKNLLHRIYSVIAELFKNSPTPQNERAYLASIAEWIWVHIFGGGQKV
jgi:hypothetical protein